MPRISLDFDRLESYCLLAATEMLRQLFGGPGDELIGDPPGDSGIPLISRIRPVAVNREYAQMDFAFKANGYSWGSQVRVAAGDVWPKEGTVRLDGRALDIDSPMVDVGVYVLDYSLRLEGSPDHPSVRFHHLEVGG